MNFLNARKAFALMLACCTCASQTLADILVSNFAEPFRGATPIGNNPNPTEPPDGGPWYWASQSFATDDVQYQLDSIEAMVGDSSEVPPPVIFAELHADSGGEIGDLISTLYAPDVSGPIAARSFTPAVSVFLSPNTAYWVVFGSEAPGDGTYVLGYIDSNMSAGPGTIGAWADSQSSGNIWNYQIDFP